MLDRILGDRKTTLSVSLVSLVVIAIVDYMIGVEIGISAFYLIPIALSAWGLGLKPALLFSAASAVLWLMNDYLIGGQYYSHPAIAYWHAAMRLIFFLTGAVSLHKLKEALEKQKALASLNAEMVSIVSHELNNHLVSAQLAASLLSERPEGEPPGESLKYHEVLEQSHRNMARTVKTFLNKARLESGRFKVETRRTEFRKLVFESLTHLSYLAKDKRIEVRTDFPEKVIPVECDPDMISLVAANLINNAIKYTPPGGGIVISLRETPGGMAEFSVTDSGIGIDKEDLDAIFSGFYRTEKGKKAASGTGLGLRVSRDFIEAHGSRLEVKSGLGRGTSFFFSLPVSSDR